MIFLPVLAAGLGLEPRYHPPEGRVLPLDDPAMRLILAQKNSHKASFLENILFSKQDYLYQG